MVSSAPTEATESNHLGIPLPQDEFENSEWIARLNTVGAVRDDAVRRLHGLLLRAARHQVSRLAGPANLGATERKEVVHSAANEAAVTVLSKLDSFRGTQPIHHLGIQVRDPPGRGGVASPRLARTPGQSG